MEILQDPLVQYALLAAAGLIAAVLVYITARTLKIRPAAQRRVQDWVDPDLVSQFDRYGTSMAARFKIAPISIAAHLRWAQTGGHYLNWSPGGLLLRSSILGAAGVLYSISLGLPWIYTLAALAAAAWPVLRVQARAEEVKKELTRMLPEVATLIAAEMAASPSAESALTRAAAVPGPLGVVLGLAVAEARSSSRPLFTRGSARGVLLEGMAQSGIPGLLRFGSQLDRVAQKGVEGSRVMSDIARGFARDYRGQVERTAANLENQLLLPVTIFFFLPFLAAMMAPLMVTIFSAL